MIKITPADAAFSLCVRERSGWACERCGGRYQPPTTALHCSHYHGRGNWSVRLEPLNAAACCMGCHLWLSANPHEHTAWQIERLGRDYELLTELKNDISRGKQYKKTHGKGEVAKHYRLEHIRMKTLRDQGELGRIEFRGWI